MKMTRATYDPIPIKQLMKGIEEAKSKGCENALKSLRRFHVEYWICGSCGRYYSPFTEHVINYDEEILCKKCWEVR